MKSRAQMNSLLVYIVATLLILDFAAAVVVSYGICDTPLEEDGICTPLAQCVHLNWLTSNKNRTALQVEYLKQSQCGFLRGEILICCPQHLVAESGPYSFISTRPRLDFGKRAELPKPPKCGSSIGLRIVGGDETKRDEYPWLVLIEYTKPGNVRDHHCSGTLINNRYVLTAAHCVLAQKPDWHLSGVRLGEWDTLTDPDCLTLSNGTLDCAPNHLDMEVEDIVVHSGYIVNSTHQYNDIALLRLSEEVRFRRNIEPVCLPLLPEQRSQTLVNLTMDVVGWGYMEGQVRSNRKRRAELTVRDPAVCSRIYRQRNINLAMTQLCAGGEANIDSCNGDSGGPLMFADVYNRTESYFLTGIVSFGPLECGQLGWPGIYTRVSSYIDWILNNIYE